jgi:hypothetical protein
MREAIKKTIVYKFEELSEKAQGKALERLYDINVDYGWWECIYEDAKTIGVEIEGFDLDRSQICEGEFLQDEWDVAANILKEHGKDCETYQDAHEFVWAMAIEENVARIGLPDDDLEDFDLDPDFCSDLLDEFRKTIFEDYRIMLETEYEYLTSEEAIRDKIDGNEYEFTEDGKIY